MDIREYSAAELSGLLPYPAPDANKYSRGTLVFLGGCARYPGAASLACGAAQRMGAGYVEAFCASETLSVLHARHPSVVARSWDELTEQIFEAHAGHPLACLIGSGMDGSDADQIERIHRAVSCISKPLVLDGGALSALATEDGRHLSHVRAAQSMDTIVTPHFGEASRLAKAANIAIPEYQDERSLASFSLALAEAYRVTVVLKGPLTFIAAYSPSALSSQVFVMRHGTEALAKAGTGDVLAGMIAALVAQGLHAVDASVLGSNVHAEAGRAAAKQLGDISVCAEDVCEAIPEALRCW